MNKTIINNIKIGLLLFPLLFILSFCQNANAEMISADNLYKMSLLTSLRTCFGNHAKSPVSYYGLSSWEKLFEKNGGGYDFYSDTSDEVWITTHVGNNLKSTHSESRTRDSNLSCEQLFKGYDGEGKAKGLLDLFQLPAISPTTMSAWGYKPVNTTPPPPSDDPTTDGSKVKITITDIESLDGNQNPITSEGKIICSAIEGWATDPSRNKYNWMLNCDGTITTKYRGDPLFIIKATYSGPGTGRIWRASAFDGHVTLDRKYDTYKPPVNCYAEDGIDQCKELTWDETTSTDAVSNLIQAAQNVFANDWSKKSALEILNGDAATNQGAGGSLIYRIRMMVESVFLSVYSEPSFKIKVEAVTNDASGEESGGDSEVGTLNYEVINDRQTAGDIFAYNVNFDESLPHFGTEVGGVKFKNYYFDHTAKYSLYYRYLLEVINLWPDEININTCSETKPENGYYFKNKIDQWCNINIPGKLTEDTMGTSILKYTFSTAEETSYQLRKGTFKQVLDWFKNEESYKGIPEDAYARGQIGQDGDLDPLDPDPGDGGGGSGDPCFTNSGSLGWILCPVITKLSETLDIIYNRMIEPLLVVKSELFSGEGSTTYTVWGIFRNIANIMFVILFLVVIFSQLTGVGIDNYGIKKILPKLIIAAVLINLSYIICQLAVDISNIAGAGLNNLFTSQAASLSGSPQGFTAGTQFKNVLNILMSLITGITVGGIVLTIVGGGLNSLPGLILPIIIGLLTAFVSVIFFFALLGIRQAGVVILVVVSPVAIACYMLPNTKKIFDKWLKMFEGLLILYPICGLLVGGSTLASAVLISGSTDFFIYMVGLLLMVVPFFFIPTLLKGSFAAMGSIGAKIQGWGNRFGKSMTGRLDKGIRNTDAFKNSQELAAERKTRIRAGIDKHGNAKKVSRFGKFMRGGDRGMGRARSQYLKDKDARNREDNLMGVGFDAAVIGQEKRAERDEIDNYITKINKETQNGEDSEALDSMYEQYMRDGNKAGAVAVARIAGRRKDTAAAFMKKYITDDSKTGNYSDAQRSILRNVAKEVSTGENSSYYRESAPLGFEFAAQVNRGKAGTNSYSEWLGARDDKGSFTNVHNAMNNYVTDTRQLVGAKGSSLNEIADLMGRDGQGNQIEGATPMMDAADIARVSTLATQAIENRDKPGASWDSTKAEQLCRISGKYNYNSATGEITLKPEYANAGGGVDGAATPGQDFQVRQPNPVVNGGAGGSTNFDVRNMENETLLDLATSPNVPIDDALRTAAEAEYSRRNPDYVRNKNGGNPTPPASS